MRVAVLGTGAVGRTLAPAIQRLGHEVVVGTRDPAATRSREDWTLDVALESFEAVGAEAELVVNATSGAASLAVIGQVGAEPLAGKVLLDVANPLDFSQGFPPALLVKDTDSLAEQIQRAFPAVRVVKSLNIVTAAVMVDPFRVGHETTMFLAGDDEPAREVVAGLLNDLGWRDVIEFTELSAARGMEMWLPLWVRLMGRLGTADFNLKIVR